MVKKILAYSFCRNSVSAYLIAVSAVIAIFIVIKIIRHIVVKHLDKLAKKTATTFDDFLILIINKVLITFSYIGAVYIGLNTLQLSPYFKKCVNIFGITILTVFIAKLISAFINYGFQIYCRNVGKDTALERSLSGIQRVIRALVWGTALIFLLDNLGFKISTVIAGLGIGGVAVALAAQAVLKDLFSYISIILDRPFEVGDFVIVDDMMGTVEYIGIKTTRIRSLSGEQIIFSNSDLTDSRLRNYKRMERRRVVFKLGVTYDTPLEKLKEIPCIIKDVITNAEGTLFDRAHFLSYGDFNLVYEIVYYVLDNDYNKYMDIQQRINFVIKDEFEKREIDFAFPTQTLYVRNVN